MLYPDLSGPLPEAAADEGAHSCYSASEPRLWWISLWNLDLSWYRHDAETQEGSSRKWRRAYA